MRQSKMLLTIDEPGSKIARNSVIQISPVANLDMIRGVPKCMQICMCAGFKSSQIFNLHFFASGIFGYLLNGKTTCIFYNFSFMNRNSEI